MVKGRKLVRSALQAGEEGTWYFSAASKYSLFHRVSRDWHLDAVRKGVVMATEKSHLMYLPTTAFVAQ
jgi:hypothetical protein